MKEGNKDREEADSDEEDDKRIQYIHYSPINSDYMCLSIASTSWSRLQFIYY